MTFDDLERPKRRSCGNKIVYAADYENFNEERSILLAA